MDQSYKTDHTNEIEDISRAREGNHTSFSNLVRKYERLIFSIAIRILRNEADACNITQDTFISAYNNLSKYREESKFSTWLTKIALNLSYGHIRKNQKHREVPIELVNDKVISVNSNPCKQLEKKEMKNLIEEKLNSLSSFHRDVIVFYYFHGYSYREISQLLECPVGTVMSRLSNARYILKKKLKPYFGGETNERT